MIRVRELFKTKWFRGVQEKLFDAYLIYGEINFAKYNKKTARF